jgi:hypothetical protein
MDDPLDNDLRNRIREVFDNYDDEYADEGWQLLREKYPKKARRSPVYGSGWARQQQYYCCFWAYYCLIKSLKKKINWLAINLLSIIQ